MNQQRIKFNIDNVSFELQEQHDFTWIKSIGTVFCVFDQQDSGNTSFGVEKNGIKLFVKYAGCRTRDFSGDPRDAISRLSAAVPLYQTLEHPDLIKLVNHFETKDGTAVFCMIFQRN